MNQRPRREARISCVGGGEVRPRRQRSVQQLTRLAAGGFEGWIVGMVELRPVHNLEVRALANREAHVGDADLEEVAGASIRAPQLGGQLHEPLGGDGRQQPGLVAEVMHGRRVRDAHASREIAQAEGRQPIMLDNLQRGLDQRPTQVAVVIGALRAAHTGKHTAVILSLTSCIAAGYLVDGKIDVEVQDVPLILTPDARTTAGVLLLTLVAVESGGWFMLRVVRGQRPATEFQKAFFRAGHAHAGVLVTLSLVAQLLVGAASLSGIWAVLSNSIWAAAILM